MANFIDKLGEQVGNSLGGGIGGAIGGMGMQMLDEALFGNRRREKQIEQQQKLTDMGTAQSKELMKTGAEQQLQMWKDTSYSAQMEQMEKAGLNPAMIYGLGGSGGGVTGTVASGGNTPGQASSESQQEQNDINRMGMGLQMQMQKAQIENIKADTANKMANANLSGSQGKTIEDSRKYMIQQLIENGYSQWLDNIGKELKFKPEIEEGTIEMRRNNTYDRTIGIQKMSLWNKEISGQLLKLQTEIESNQQGISESQARENKLISEKILTDQRALGYWTELTNATIQANSQAINAAAHKLSAEWGTGEYTNWKTWADLADKTVGTVIDGVKAFK